MSVVASVRPTDAARVRLRPLGSAAVRIEGGLLGERQRVNHEITLLRGAEELERAGTLDNFRIAAGTKDGGRRGMVFSDSDVYKWLEAIAWELGRAPSPELERLAAQTIALVGAAQEPDGYLNTWCRIVDPGWRWSDLEMGHELYCAGHLIQAAVAFSRATGDVALLGIARRFADLIHEVFTGGLQPGTEGHPEIEAALVELYRETGDRRYLELSDALVSRRGSGQFAGGRFDLAYYQDAEPVRGSRSIVGHAVRALYLAAGVTDLYAETGDESLLASMLGQWQDLASSKTYLTGGVGSRHSGEAFGEPYELPPDRAYCETCAAIASIPEWARGATIDGEPVEPGRYAELTRSWSAGERVVLELDVSARLTVANPRIDAVRGCLALERGPIVYCFESTDLPDGVDLLDVALGPDPHPEDVGPVEPLAGVPGVSVAGVVNELDGWEQSEYLDLRARPDPLPAAAARLRAVPYFTWANRGDSAMRVWVPRSD
jgi:DUF1680 family protein